MNFTTILFYFFSIVLVSAAIRVICSNNPIESALFLILCFFNASALWMILKAEFLAMLLVLIYVGAVTVLFLFIVMMLNLRLKDVSSNTKKRYGLLGYSVGFLFFFQLTALVFYTFKQTSPNIFFQSRIFSAHISGNANNFHLHDNNILKLGMLLFKEYIFAFEIVGLLLLLAVLSSVAIVMTKFSTKAKHIDPSKQVKVKASDRLRMIDMPSDKMN